MAKSTQAMLYLTRPPAPPLSHYIEYLWYLRCGPHFEHTWERVLPTGTVELVVDLWDDFRRQESLLIGPHSKFYVLKTDVSFHAIGAHFWPAGAVPFLGAPAGEFNNMRLELADVWEESAVRSLRQRLLDSPTPEQRLKLFELCLQQQLSSQSSGHPAVAMALPAFLQVPHSLTISEAIRSAGLSSTRFVHLFRREVGLTPKLFCRVQRFQAASRRIGLGDERPAWADLALDCGYSDQAHFTREFRAFSGSSPTAYLDRRTEILNHVREGGFHARTVVEESHDWLKQPASL